MILVAIPTGFTPSSDIPTPVSGYMDIEFPQINKNTINVKFEPVFIEKTMMSGKIKKLLKGHRLVATWNYNYLTDSQRVALDELFKYDNGRAEIQFPVPSLPNNPDGSTFWSGYVYFTFNGENNRFKRNPSYTPAEAEEYAKYVWKDFEVSIISEDII